MNQNTYVNITTAIFVVIALLHLARTVLGWEVSVAGWDVPAWVSWVAFMVASFLAYTGFQSNTQR